MSVLWGLGHRLDDLEVAKVVTGPPEPSAKMPPLLRRSEYSTVTIPGVGNARVRWWLFESRDKRRQNVAHGFVSIFTHDGQVHHSWDQTRFIGLVPNRARVAQRIFVEVDLEGIPRRQRIQILSSIREALRKTPEARKLEEKVADWLGKDADLEEAEAHFIREALRNAQQHMTKDFLDKLNRAIAAKIPSIEVLIDRKGGAGRMKKPKPKPQDELLPEPTAFTGAESITIMPGETHVFYMSVNAENGFIPTKGQIEMVESQREAELSLSAVGDLRSGRVQLSVTAGDNAALGKHQATLALTWLRSSGGVNELRWPLNITVLSERQQAQLRPPSKESGLAKEGKKRSQVALVWHRLEDEKDDGWTVDTAGDLQKMSGEALAGADPELYGDLKDVAGDIPTIVLNEDHGLWKTYEAAALVKSDLARKVRRDRYALAIGVAVANLWVREEAIAGAYETWLARGNGGDEPPKAMTPDQRRRALSEAARGILTVLPDFDRLVVEDEVAASA